SIMVILFIISLFSLPFVLHSFVLFILISLVWSVTIWGISSPIQYYLIKAAPQSADLALSLNISALNIGIALGSLVGGAVLLKLPVTTEPWIGGTFGIVGLALLFLLKKMSVNQMK
ncbi:MAG TPA: MFS transporter, partial [Massilibacterium sp.]|nr:MFS transporter [Massilibacterium sp.]